MSKDKKYIGVWLDANLFWKLKKKLATDRKGQSEAIRELIRQYCDK